MPGHIVLSVNYTAARRLGAAGYLSRGGGTRQTLHHCAPGNRNGWEGAGFGPGAGASKNAVVVEGLRESLVERGVRPDRQRLFVTEKIFR